MSAPRILAFAGSARRESVNRKLLAVAAAEAHELGAEVTVAELADYAMPIYDGDLEEEHGLPDVVLRWKALFDEHDGLLIACPEYNSSITPLLKNAIDWASRKAEGESPLQAFRGKTAGLLAASPGGLGGLRGLVTVRSILGSIGVHVMPTQFALSKAHEAFDDAGGLRNDGARKQVRGVVEQLVETTRRLAS